ncbi:MAG TPA: IS4 family transposase, partial [Polyangiaceae bacterium]|nr:IS4 family transposase [Polyangiaceae bacterium]
ACSLVLSAYQRSTDTQGRWLDAQRLYEQLGGPPSSKTSFRNGARRCRRLLEALVCRGLAGLAADAPPPLRGRLSHFADVLIPDGCAFKLAAALSGLYQGTGTAAELKLHAVYSVREGGAVAVTPSAGNVHDSDGFWPATWQEGALYLWDLGYQHNGRFLDAQAAGAHVLQRLKHKANPVALRSYGPTGASRFLAHDDGRPMRLDEAITFGFVHKRAVLDLDIELRDEAGRRAVARVVCVPFDGEDRSYLTTLPRAIFSAHDVAELYRIRWEVELLFRSWKGALRLDEVERLRHPASLQTAVYAALCASLLSTDAHRRLEALGRVHAAASPAAFPP